MSIINIGIIREGKIPPDFRVPLNPAQCIKLQQQFANVRITVQRSPIRCFADHQYAELGICVQEDLSHCDIILGVKEVPKEALIANKTYLFFSHTIKKQSYNQALLQEIVRKKIRLIDYEVLKNTHNKRVIGFGRYAGIVGTYNAFLAYGLKTGLYALKAAHLCSDRTEVEKELKKVILPKNFRATLTGFGRVGNGAREILALLPIKEVSDEAYINQTFEEPVFTHLDTHQYFERSKDGGFDKSEFYAKPDLYQSKFGQFADNSELYIPCHYWSAKSPKILTQSMLKSPSCKLKVVADISCDVKGPIACTIRSSKIGASIYGYNPMTDGEVDFMQDNAIAVMAVDNLPCELPKDASSDFGAELIEHVIDNLLGPDTENMIYGATITTKDGKLNSPYEYLSNYAFK